MLKVTCNFSWLPYFLSIWNSCLNENVFILYLLVSGNNQCISLPNDGIVTHYLNKEIKLMF